MENKKIKLRIANIWSRSHNASNLNKQSAVKKSKDTKIKLNTQQKGKNVTQDPVRIEETKNEMSNICTQAMFDGSTRRLQTRPIEHPFKRHGQTNFSSQTHLGEPCAFPASFLMAIFSTTPSGNTNC